MLISAGAYTFGIITVGKSLVVTILLIIDALALNDATAVSLRSGLNSNKLIKFLRSKVPLVTIYVSVAYAKSLKILIS